MFKFTSTGASPSIRDTAGADTLLRKALGDKPRVTALLMELSNGSRAEYKFKFGDMRITVVPLNVRFYDNGGTTADRYTAVYLDIDEGNGLCGARGMSSNPMHPQGVGMYCSAQDGEHLGKRIEFADLPVDCQKVVIRDLQS